MQHASLLPQKRLPYSFSFTFIAIIFLVLTTKILTAPVSPTWTADPSFQSGAVTITSSTQSGTFNQNFTVILSQAVAPSMSYYNIVIGLNQFIIPSVNRIQFKFGKNSKTLTSFVLNCQFGNQTVFQQLQVNYMAIDNSYTDMQLVFYDYSCAVLNQSQGYRSQKIQYIATKVAGLNFTYLQAQIVVQSFNHSNYKGYYHTLYSEIVQSNHTFTIQLITTNFNLFHSIQLWLMIVDYAPMNLYLTTFQDLQNYVFNSTFGMTNYVGAIQASFLAADRYFFAISNFNFTKQATVTFKVDTSTPANFALNYQLTNIDFIRMSAYFRAKRSCPTSNYYRSLSNLCDTTCIAPQPFYDATNKLCTSCHYSCGLNSCNSALSTECFTCYDASRQSILTSTLANGTNMYSCPCATGYFLGYPVCYQCANYIAGCTSCSDGLTCTNCNTANGLVLNGTKCKCSDNTKTQIGDQCYSLIGCTAVTMPGSTICTECSWQRGFQFLDTYVCVCQSYKSMVQINPGDYYCLYTCGDGYVSPDEQCDDGNNANGDGCSMACKVQTNFSCSGILNITSVCLYDIQISLQYLGTTRQIYDNKAQIYFKVSPKDSHLQSITDLTSLIVTSIPYSNLKASLLSIKSVQLLSTDYYLQVVIDYNSSIQIQAHSLYINLTNFWQWRYDSTQSSFTPAGVNAMISFDSDSNLNKQQSIQYIILSLVGIAYLISFISIFFDRMIGIQLMVTVQTMYYLLSHVQINPIQLVPLEKSLQYSTGYNKISNLIPTDYPQYLRTYFLPSNFQHKADEKQFVLNFNFSFAVLLITLLVIFIFYLANKCRKIQFQSTQDLLRFQIGRQSGQSCCSIQKNYECLFNRVLVYVAFWTMPQIIFAICIQTNQYQPDFYLFQDSINVLSSFISFLLLIFMILGLAYWYMKQNAQSPAQKKGLVDQSKNLVPLSFKICKIEYPLVYLIYQFVKFMLIALFLEYAVSLDIILCLQVVYFIFIVIYRPYLRNDTRMEDNQDQQDLKNQCFSIHNFTIASNQLILIGFCFSLMLWNQLIDNYNFQSSYPSLIVYISIIFILILNVIGLLRLFYKKLGKLYCCEPCIQKLTCFKSQAEGSEIQFQHMRKLYTKNDLEKMKKAQQEDSNDKKDQNQSQADVDKKSILKDLKKNKTNFVNWPQFKNIQSQQNYSNFPQNQKTNNLNKTNSGLNTARDMLGKSKLIQDYTQRDISLLISNPDSIDQSIDILNKTNKKVFKGLNWVQQTQIQPIAQSSSKVKLNSSNQSVLQSYLQKSSEPVPYVTDFVIRKSSNKKQAQLKKSGLQLLIQQKMTESKFLDPIKQQNDQINLQQVKQRFRQELQQKNSKRKLSKNKRQQFMEGPLGMSEKHNNQGDEMMSLLDKSDNRKQQNMSKSGANGNNNDKNAQNNPNSTANNPMMKLFAFKDGI